MRANMRNRLIESRLTPNAISMTGLVLNVVAAVLVTQRLFFLAGVAFVVGSLMDTLDGRYSRMSGKGTLFGAFLDSTLDRLVDMAVLAGMIMYYASHGSPWIALVAGVALVSSVLVSYAKARAEVVMRRLDAGFFERGERMGILSLGAVTGYLPIALAVVAVGATATALQRIAIAHREMEKIDAAARVSEGQTP
jgi:CDP-diacylglycerol--glycerol-3-phosphate 3-phosphatidyltransferase